MNQRARFIGPEPSMGYEPQKDYYLIIVIVGHVLWISCQEPAGPLPCPYSSLTAFLANWQPL